MSFFNELKRRNVFRIAGAYLVTAWLAIQVVETVFPAFGFGPSAVRIVTILFAVAFIPCLVLAWAFELTPEGVKKEKDVNRQQSVTPATGKKLDRLILVVLALALGYFLLDKFMLSDFREAAMIEEAKQEARSEALASSYGKKSIAVLPFRDMSKESDQEYFSDGISEELLNLLAQIPELRVISRSSSFSYKGRDFKVAIVARELNASHILEGSVRKAGNKVRITAQLIEPLSDTQLWSANYDRTLDDIFVIQDEIASEVVEQLKLQILGSPPTIKQTNPEAFALFLQARHLGRQGTAQALEKSLDFYRQALADNPDYPAAWVGMAEIYSEQASNGQRPVVEGVRLAREAAKKALALDSGFAPTYAQLGLIAMDFDHNLAMAAKYYEQALELAPNDPDILGGASTLARSLGQLELAIQLLNLSLARDPVNPTLHFNLGLNYIFAGRLDEAINSLGTTSSLSPGRIGVQARLGDALMLNGELDAALAVIQQESFEGWQMVSSALTYHALGRVDESDAILADLIEKYGDGAAYNIAYIYAFRGESDRAFEWLEKAVELEDSGLVDIPVENLFSNIFDDQRWLPFLESIGKSPAQLDAIEFKVTLPE